MAMATISRAWSMRFGFWGVVSTKAEIESKMR